MSNPTNETHDQLIESAWKEQNKELRHIFCYIAGRNARQLSEKMSEIVKDPNSTAQQAILALSRAHFVFLTRIYAACSLYESIPPNNILEISLTQMAIQLELKMPFKKFLEKEIKELNKHINECEAFK